MANLLRPLASIPHGLAVKVLKVVACVFIVYTVWMAQQLNAYKKRGKEVHQHDTVTLDTDNCYHTPADCIYGDVQSWFSQTTKTKVVGLLQ